VQIRTPEMHRVAELGIAAHWRYKEEEHVSDQELEGVEWLRQLLEWQKDVRDSREFMRYVKFDLFQEEVHVFTPKGKVVSLPQGSTPIDFAYAIHTEVGHQCVGARIGGRLVPLRTELKNGDIVEIITQSGHAPSRDWLGIVRTGRARHKIRSHLRKVERERSIEIGRSMLERESRRSGIGLKGVSDERKQEALDKLKLNAMDDLYAQLGLGKLTPAQFLELIAPDQVKPREAEPDHTSLLKRMTGAFKRDRGKVLVHGFGDTMISLAGCCNPIPGDAIVGYITRGRGVSVHKEDCPNLEGLLQADPEREIAVAWAAETEKSRFDVGLRILTENRPGRLARVALLLEQEKINIRHADAEVGDDGRGTIWVVAEIENRRQVERLIDKIGRIDGVYHVERAAPHASRKPQQPN
jgi:GTP pyrophosphokinase